MDFEPIISIASKATSQLMTFIEDAAMASLQLNRSATVSADGLISRELITIEVNMFDLDHISSCQEL